MGLLKKISLVILVLMLSSCFNYEAAYQRKYKSSTNRFLLPTLKYSIQVGAFKELENAIALVEKIRSYNTKPFYFRDRNGEYKVRFGNFVTKNVAEERGKKLVALGVVEDYYVITPENYKVKAGGKDIRANLVNTAKQYIGLPYKWGGTSPTRGFDCSGLTMVTYRINGYNIPRTSREQYKKGKYVGLKNLNPGDLVFFDIKRRGRVSHVGLYVGGGKFIHAPRKGKKIHITSLYKKYYKQRFVGGRSYL
ncbi:MAG: hydrolase [Desulfobacterales bacterium]|nr:hydrolase [Desulfobacterales bacterium]MCP4160300.1 hydrolase [Deltaproteobacteria bacterium]